ncbi:TATA-box-binding protein [Halorubrum ezzemoulense]|uniref:TATA-box-binding protein n=1 Tax=Halorubrum ezzemoulense TaxID=337243 RepID=UPI00232E10B0|nr:TATA-box-binding protein [Halorubrum ezzemoulense]MDB2281304.1 TATA-box-binding protein [Halorubrum ezzemoulense]
MMVEIANIVGSGDLDLELDLETLESDLQTPFLEYDPANYHGLYVRLETGGPLVTIYRSGKYIISGCSSMNELEETNKEFISDLIQLDIVYDGQNVDFNSQNVVCTADLSQDISLNHLSIGLGLESTEYEPEQFPGLIYRPNSIDSVLLVFANGRVVITGAESLKTAECAFSHLSSKIDELDLDS